MFVFFNVATIMIDSSEKFSCKDLNFSFCVLLKGTAKVAQNSFQHLDFDWSFITILYHLMPQSWYQKTAQSLVNTLFSFP